MTTPQPEPRMPEQLEKLINEGVEAWRRQHDTATPAAEAWPAFMAAWLISHGWGPRPTVTRQDLVDHIARMEAHAPVIAGVMTISADSMASAVVPFLREHGIEVTE